MIHYEIWRKELSPTKYMSHETFENMPLVLIKCLMALGIKTNLLFHIAMSLYIAVSRTMRFD